MFLFHTKNNNRCNNKSNSGGKKIYDHGFWAQYFSVNDLNTMWRTLVEQTFFWGDRFVATVSAISVVPPTDGLVTDNRLTFDGAMYDTERGVRNAMERWMNGMNAHSANTGLSTPIAYEADLLVEQLDRSGDTLKKYTFRGSYPQDMSPIDLNYGTNDEIERFTVTFAYQYFETDTTT